MILSFLPTQDFLVFLDFPVQDSFHSSYAGRKVQVNLV